MEISRRDLVKLAATVGIVSALPLTLTSAAQQTAQKTAAEEVKAPVICGACGAMCGLIFVKRGDKMYLLPNLEHPQPGMCFRPASALQLWNHPLRLKKPLKRVGNRGEGKFQEVDWDTALNEIAQKLRDIVNKYGPESVAFTRHDFHSWILPFIASVLGTPNVVGHESTCHGASTVARGLILGAGGPNSVDPDYENVTYLLLVGRTLDAAIGLVRRLAKARERGVKIVVVDPRAPNLAYSSVEWVPIIPGTDTAFVLSLINVIISQGLYDAAFLKKYTNAPFLIKPDGKPLTEKDLGGEGSAYLVYDNAAKSLVPHDKAQDPALDYEGVVQTPQGEVRVKTAFKLLAERAAKYPPEEAEKITGVPAADIRRIAIEFATARGVAEDGWYAAKNGNELDLYMAILILNALVGNIDKRGGLCFQESAKYPSAATTREGKVVTILHTTDVGIPVQDIPAPKAKRVDKVAYPLAPSVFDALLDAIITEKPYPIKALFIVATAPFTRDVNTEKLKQALSKLELVVAIDVMPQDHVDWCDYVLPDLMFLERGEMGAAKWTLHAAVVYSEKVLDPPPGVDARDAFWALMEIIRRAFPEKAAAVGYTEKYADPHAFEEYEEAIKKAVIISLANAWNLDPEKLEEELKTKGFYILKKKSYEARPYKAPLGTPSGKVEIYALRALQYGRDPLPDWRPPLYKLPSAPDELYLVNGKDPIISAHMVMAKNAKWIVNRAVWMNPVDAERLGVKDGDAVELEGLDNGFKARAVVKVTNRVRPGVLFTYSMAGGRTSKLITDGYDFLREGVNPEWFASGKLEPVSGTAATNASVRVRRL